MGSATLDESRENLRCQWNQFKHDIRDIHQQFNQFYWIRTLFIAALKYGLCLTRIAELVDFIKINRGHFIQFIPAFALSLVCSVLSAYYFVLHDEVTVRWCEIESSCFSSNLILAIACYITFMILFYYLSTVFTSPGVVKTIEPGSTSSVQSWKSYKGQGGLCYINATLHASRENELTELYSRGEKKDSNCVEKCGQDNKSTNRDDDLLRPKSGSVFIPSPYSSYCKKCKINRPPRSHHCSQCNRCVLQVRLEYASR